MKNWVLKVYKVTIILSLMIVCSLAHANSANADLIDKVEISIASETSIIICNKESEKLDFDIGKQDTGSMPILKETYLMTTPLTYVYTVRSSDSYVIKKDEKGYSVISILNQKNKKYVSVVLNDVATISVDMDRDNYVEISGNKQNYSISIGMNDSKFLYELEGELNGNITMKDKETYLEVIGMSGKAFASIDDIGNVEDDKFNPTINQPYYLLGGTTILGIKDGIPYVENAIKLNNKSSKKLEGLYVRPINNDKEMLLTWMKVKKANSYIVYKYDNEKNKYKKVVTLNGNDNNCFSESIVNNEIYRYKVVAKKKKNGKGKKVCNVSYEVWAVPDKNVKSNAIAVTLDNYKKIVLKNDNAKKFKLKSKGAKVIYSSKVILSKKIRWYCSNKRVLKINNKKGKMKALKKGKCYIWAKAHNGINSKKIKVIIK